MDCLLKTAAGSFTTIGSHDFDIFAPKRATVSNELPPILLSGVGMLQIYNITLARVVLPDPAEPFRYIQGIHLPACFIAKLNSDIKPHLKTVASVVKLSLKNTVNSFKLFTAFCISSLDGAAHTLLTGVILSLSGL